MNKKYLFPTLVILLFFGIILTYSNHFHNNFQFDDSHTIVDNVYIKDMKNFSKFFTDGSTLTPLPANQSYRPMATLSYAFDYWMAGKKLDTFYFHLSNFFWYLVQLVFMYFLFIKIFNLAFKHEFNKYFALFAVGWYGLHTANAETINYICARSDSYSTLFVIIAFVMFLYSKTCRKWFLYFIPLILGCLMKPTALMLAPFLFFYIFLFEKNISLTEILKKKNFKSIIQTIYLTLPVFMMAAILYLFQKKMTPSTFTPSYTPLYNYLITQPFVFAHYLWTFFVPNTLSADSDWQTLPSIANYRFFIGMLINLFMVFIAFRTSKKQLTRPIAFGILWFYIALIPTTMVPLAEVLNDHRTFFPYVGLMISVCWALIILFYKYEKAFANAGTFKFLVVCFALFILFSNAYGTRERNKVWATEETLWHDVTIKSPKNGRGLMNYGLTQMRQGKYEAALQYFQQALVYNPYYTYLYVNIGIVKNSMNNPTDAEDNFKKAIQYGPDFYDAYYYYAQFLSQHDRDLEAIPLLKQSIALSPAYMSSRYLLMQVYQKEYDWDQLSEFAQQTLQIIPNDSISLRYIEASRNRKTRTEEALDLAKQNPTAENYLNLSLVYYNERMYQKCVDACNEALKIKPNYAEAYNNIASAENMLGKWIAATDACNKCLNLKPGYSLALGNLNLIRTLSMAENAAISKNTAVEYLNLSLVFFQNHLYEKSISACEQALKLKPNYAEAYNNICSSYNAMYKWDDAINACTQCLQIKPDYDLAKNNLDWAKKNKK
jgi:tetratricopeptide (TPR) repeat protein